MVAVNPIGEPGRASGGSDDGIEIVFGEDGVDTLDVYKRQRVRRAS